MGKKIYCNSISYFVTLWTQLLKSIILLLSNSNFIRITHESRRVMLTSINGNNHHTHSDKYHIFLWSKRFSLEFQMTCSCMSWKCNFRLVFSPVHALLKQRSRLISVNLIKLKVKADVVAFDSSKPFQKSLLLNFSFYSSTSVEVY